MSCRDRCRLVSLGSGFHLVGANSWSVALPRYLTRWDLVGRSASLACSAGTWLVASPRWLAWWGLRRPLCLAGLLGRDLVGRSASLASSSGTWSVAPLASFLGGTWLSALSRWLALQGLGRSLYRAGLLGWEAIMTNRFIGFTSGTPFLGTRQQPLSPRAIFKYCLGFIT
jgi:hypothetical protein